jgi:hypothetical protein
MAVSSAVIRDGKYQAGADGSEVAQEGCGVSTSSRVIIASSRSVAHRLAKLAAAATHFGW